VIYKENNLVKKNSLLKLFFDDFVYCVKQIHASRRQQGLNRGTRGCGTLSQQYDMQILHVCSETDEQPAAPYKKLTNNEN